MAARGPPTNRSPTPPASRRLRSPTPPTALHLRQPPADSARRPLADHAHAHCRQPQSPSARTALPPHNYAAVEAAAAEPGGALSEDYGRYGAEEPAERYSRVLNRPADALFDMESVRTYSLTAQPDGD